MTQKSECASCASDRIKLSDYHAHVLRNDRATDALFIMELEVDVLDNPVQAKPELASALRPGQFVHMSIPTLSSHILRRPFSIYAANASTNRVEILYQKVGEGTAEMTRWQPGQGCDMIGPIGRGWCVPEKATHALVVGGGVGAAPLFMLYEQLVERGIDTDVVLGAATKGALVCHDRYAGVCGCAPLCSTDDGTFGREGFCTSLVEEAIAASIEAGNPYDYGVVCGPEPLMRTTSRMMIDAGITCEVSMEKRMACGVGACLSCVVDTVQGKKRACVDGPVFDAREVVW